MESRLTDLETRFMHQEHNLQELNDIVYRQEQTIERLELELRLIKEQLKMVLPSLARYPEDEEPPPHY
jgi:SlyX protein